MIFRAGAFVCCPVPQGQPALCLGGLRGAALAKATDSPEREVCVLMCRDATCRSEYQTPSSAALNQISPLFSPSGRCQELAHGRHQRQQGASCLAGLSWRSGGSEGQLGWCRGDRTAFGLRCSQLHQELAAVGGVAPSFQPGHRAVYQWLLPGEREGTGGSHR